jgi:hypothetical protein
VWEGGEKVRKKIEKIAPKRRNSWENWEKVGGGGGGGMEEKMGKFFGRKKKKGDNKNCPTRPTPNFLKLSKTISLIKTNHYIFFCPCKSI